ncbi:MAG: DUF1801 domain-containing protein [Deferribacteres bacterium]|nr:DUF1801 domain-containing protein [candidate division KSB1 bacterium]MCB9502380.1 DUF1801 domain-containing protein [Deferribacteres bacterium]
MAEPKTKPTEASVSEYINTIEDETRREDCWTVHKIMREVTQAEPIMWGPSIVGYGTYHYVYKSGQEGDWMITGFANRKQALTLYIMAGFSKYDELMARLGKFQTGKSCLYVKKLADIDLDILQELIKESVAYMNAKYHS